MLRRLFTIASALSLLLCVATAALWVTSQWHGGQAEWNTRTARYQVESTADGWTAHVRHLTPHPPDVDAIEIHLSGHARQTVRVPGAPVRGLNLPGLKVEQGFADGGTLVMGGLSFPPSGDTYEQVSVRWWLTFLFAGVLPVAWLSRAARRRSRPGFCPICGYDLRATPGRCPECGTSAPSAR